MNLLLASLPPASLLALATFGGGSVSQDALTIGGPGSCSSEGTQDPGLLSDDETPASAEVVFTLDTGAAVLTLDVTNTSPVTSGVKNPLLTRLYFNVPAAVTGMSLVGQSAEAGVTPEYELDFGPQGAGLFGSFDACLHDTGNIQGTIANENADTWTVGADKLALGTVSFTLELEGDLAGLTASDFTELLSTIPPGSKPSHAVGKFQAGGPDDASAYLNQGETCDVAGSSESLGTPCGGTLSIVHGLPGGSAVVDYQGSTPLGLAALYYSAPNPTPFSFGGCTIFLRGGASLAGLFATDLDGDFHLDAKIPSSHLCGDQIVLQAFVLGPRPPRFAEISNGVLVTIGN